jgi:hypothetical protein
MISTINSEVQLEKDGGEQMLFKIKVLTTIRIFTMTLILSRVYTTEKPAVS